MATVFPNTRSENHNDRLGFSIFIAIAAHAMVIFGIGFKLLEQKQAPVSLEITLAQHKSDTSNEQADFLAQFNQKGSGSEQAFTEITRKQPDAAPDIEQKKLQAAAPQLLQQRELGLSTLTTKSTADDSSNRDQQKEPLDSPSVPLPPAMLQQISSLKAQLSDQQKQYSRLPRTRRLTTASTKAASEAAYLHYWINHVETVGNQNYPQEARRKKLYGDLRLAVTLLPDGTVENVEILLSSGQRVLDQAAIRIVRMASPFSPLPAEMRDWDKLEIIRTWRFEQGHTLHTEN